MLMDEIINNPSIINENFRVLGAEFRISSIIIDIIGEINEDIVLVEVKGASSPSIVYSAKKQLLSYISTINNVLTMFRRDRVSPLLFIYRYVGENLRELYRVDSIRGGIVLEKTIRASRLVSGDDILFIVSTKNLPIIRALKELFSECDRRCIERLYIRDISSLSGVSPRVVGQFLRRQGVDRLHGRDGQYIDLTDDDTRESLLKLLDNYKKFL